MKNLFNKNIIISSSLFIFALALFLVPNITKIEATTFVFNSSTINVNLNISVYKPGNTITVSSSTDIYFQGTVYAEIVDSSGTIIGSNKMILSVVSGSNIRSSSTFFTAPTTLADYTMRINAYYTPVTDSKNSYCYGNYLAIQGLCDPSFATISIPFTVSDPILNVYANDKTSESFINFGNVNIYWIPNFDTQSCTCTYSTDGGLNSSSCGSTVSKRANERIFASSLGSSAPNSNNSYYIIKNTTFEISCEDGANCSDPCSGTYTSNTLGSQIDWNGTAMAWNLGQIYSTGTGGNDQCRDYYVSSCNTTSCKWQYDQYAFDLYGFNGGGSASGQDPTCGNDIGNTPIASNITSGNARIITTTNNSCGGLSQSSCVSYTGCSWNSGSTCSTGSTAASPINGLCGTTNNSCTSGSLLDNADTSSNYYWTCNGSNGGATAYCSVPKVVNGSCGTTNNSCTAGTLNDVTDNIYYYLWNCNGLGGGSIATCSLPKSTKTIKGVK